MKFQESHDDHQIDISRDGVCFAELANHEESWEFSWLSIGSTLTGTELREIADELDRLNGATR